MRRLAPLPLALVLALLAPAAAPARWPAPRALPSVPPYSEPLIGAIDDHGRAVVTYPTEAGTRLVRLSHAGGPGRPVRVADVTGTETLALLADGTAVGVGTRHVLALQPSPWPDCCEELVTFRQPAAGGAVVTQEQPAGLEQGNWGPVASAIGPDGTASVLAGLGDAITGEQPSHYVVESARVGDAGLVLGGAPFLLKYSAATAGRALSRGRAAFAWRGKHEIHVLELRDGMPVRDRAFRAGYAADETIALDGSGRVVRAGESGGRLWLWPEGHGRHLIMRGYNGLSAYTLTGGPHDTSAIAFIDHDRIRLASLDHGHFHGPTTLGHHPSTALPDAAPLVAIDAHDGIHVAWATRGGGIVIHDPHTTHRIPTRHTAELTDFTVSPSGADLVLWTTAGHAFAARSAP
jgi:hypothetical protein